MRLAVIFHRPGATPALLERALRSLGAEDAVEMALPDEVFVAPHDMALSTQSWLAVLNEREGNQGEVRAEALGGDFTSIASFRDEFAAYEDVLPGPFSSGELPESLASVVNHARDRSLSGYALVMSPTETCADPANIERTLAFLDNRTTIQVVCAPVKIFDSGEHVATIMEPKIYRLGRVRAAGPLADRHEPSTEGNHMLAASGLEFRDHDDSFYSRRADVDLKLRLRRWQAKKRGDDGAGDMEDRRLAIELCRELLKCRPSAAIDILRPIIDKLGHGSPAAAAPFATLGRALDMVGEVDEARRCFDQSVSCMPTPDALLARGLHRWRVRDDSEVGGGWRGDLQLTHNLVREVTSYGLDLRELARATKLLTEDVTTGGRP